MKGSKGDSSVWLTLTLTHTLGRIKAMLLYGENSITCRCHSFFQSHLHWHLMNVLLLGYNFLSFLQTDNQNDLGSCDSDGCFMGVEAIFLSFLTLEMIVVIWMEVPHLSDTYLTPICHLSDPLYLTAISDTYLTSSSYDPGSQNWTF